MEKECLEKRIEQLEFENKKLKCENEYIKHNLEALKKLNGLPPTTPQVVTLKSRIKRKLKKILGRV